MTTTPNTQDLVTGEDSEYFSIQFAASLINALWRVVEEKTDSAEKSIQDAVDMTDGGYKIAGDFGRAFDEGLRTFEQRVVRPDLPAKPQVRTAPVVPARVDAPDVPVAPVLDVAPALPAAPVLGAPPTLGDIDTAVLQQLFWTNRDDIMEELKTAFREFADEWFPAGTYFDKATAWLEKALGEGGTSINVAVEEALWERDRARLTAEAQRAEDEAMTLFASRGYTLPPGALAHSVLNVRQGLTNSLSQQSRDIAIKAHQDEIENARLAVQQAIGLRNSALTACINYMQALAVGPQMAVSLANAQGDLQARMASARADLYRAVTGAQTEIYKTVTQTQVDAYRATSGAKSDFYRAEVGAKTELYRADVDGWRAGVTAEADVYRAATTAEADAYRTVVDALTRMYSTDAQVAQVPLDTLFRKAGLEFSVADANLKSDLAMVDARVRAVVAKAQQVATQAAAALNNLNVGTQVSNGTTTSFVQRT